MPSFGDYQNEIYLNGLRGTRPKLPVDFKSIEAKACAALPPSIPSYVQGGCGDERTQELNSSAFQRWGLLPRMMVDCSQRDLSIDLFGMKLPTPLFMSPIGVIGLCA
jgi:lactate 2-monooxygenase